MARFSIVIPCHNAAPYVGDSIQSCLDQTVDDLEVIVVDDGSSDGSAAVIAAAAGRDPRVRPLTQPQQGVGAARNAGLAVAEGEYIGFLDADDVIEPRKLELQGQLLDAEPQLGLVLCDGFVIDAKGRVLWDSLVDARRLAAHPSLFEVCFRGGPFPPLVPLVRRSLVVAAGGFDAHPDAAGWADVDLWMRLALLGTDYRFVPERLVRYRQTGASMSTDRERMERAARFVFAKAMREHPDEAVSALRAAHARLRDYECASGQLRRLVGTLAAEHDAATQARNAMAIDRAHAAGVNAQLRRALADTWYTLLNVLVDAGQASAGRPLMIWGAGAAGRGLLRQIEDAGGSARAFIDSDPAKVGTVVEQVPVVAPAALGRPTSIEPFVLVASVHSAEIEDHLRTLGRRHGHDYHVVGPEEIAL